MQGAAKIFRTSINNVSRVILAKNNHKFIESTLHKKYSISQLNSINTRTMSTGPVYTVEYLNKKLKDELQAEHIDIEDLSNCGCGMKFDAVIVSPKFEGKQILQRQRLVNQVLTEEMKHIHAFTMRTLTPDQWKQAQNQKTQQ